MRILAQLGLVPWGSSESLLPPPGAGSVLGTAWGRGCQGCVADTACSSPRHSSSEGREGIRSQLRKWWPKWNEPGRLCYLMEGKGNSWNCSQNQMDSNKIIADIIVDWDFPGPFHRFSVSCIMEVHNAEPPFLFQQFVCLIPEHQWNNPAHSSSQFVPQ